MSVACCRVPNFLLRLTQRRHPEWAGRPLALLGADEQVWSVSPEARLSGVRLQMDARQAQMRCPDVLLRPLDLPACQAEQHALLGALARSGLPLEAQTWGTAYVDLHSVARTVPAAQAVCQDLGKQVAAQLGAELEPSIGWDTGKFTARAAAGCAKPRRICLVDSDREAHFLIPLPITLLPLPPLTLPQLDWLGIRTLGQFASLPKMEVWRRFGPAGKLAQQWALGQDRRPVCATLKNIPEPLDVAIDPPTAVHGPVLEQLWATLQPPLAELAARLEGCRRLRLELSFSNAESRTLDCAFVEPLGAGPQLRARLSGELQNLNWPAELDRLRVTVLESSELVARQLSLFAADESQAEIMTLAQNLAGRYGAVLHQAQVVHKTHPLFERRSIFQAVGV